MTATASSAAWRLNASERLRSVFIRMTFSSTPVPAKVSCTAAEIAVFQ